MRLKKVFGSSSSILIGLLGGIAVGAAFNFWGPNPIRDWCLTNVIDPIGQFFLRALFIVVVPLVFSSIIVGVANLGSAAAVRRLGTRIGIFYVLTTLIAIFIGQFLVTLVRPGQNVSPDLIEASKAGLNQQMSGLLQKGAAASESLWPGLVSTLVPKNILEAMANGNMLGIIFISIVVGLALIYIPKDSVRTAFQSVLEAVSEVCIVLVGWTMKIAPVAVGALMASVVSKMGAGIFLQLIQYVAVVVVGLSLHFFVIFSLILFLLRIPVRQFYRLALPVFVTSFSTSSSNATIPTSIRTLETSFKIPPKIASFSIPLGATVNMNGTALFEVVSALFIAQIYGVTLGLEGQITLVLLVLLTAIGVAGVPGGSIPLLMAAMATVGIPPEGIALILGVDRFLDMCRTVVNVTGDLVGALYLAKVEGWKPPAATSTQFRA